jgi:hypothetical protein
LFFSTLRDLKHVATTADGWSSGGKSYLGVTVHWIDPKTRRRKSAVLACCQMTQSHTFAYLGELLSGVHKKFAIENSVCLTTTDNASNFAKAFRVFGRTTETTSADVEDDVVGEKQLAAMPVKSIYTVEIEDAILPEGEEEEDVGQFVALEDLLPTTADMDDPERNPYKLPGHARCAAHTLNLIASSDVDKVKASPDFDANHGPALQKASKIWQHHQRSDMFAAAVKALAGHRLKLPVVTRWNSTFDSLQVLNRILTDPKTK